MAIRIKLLLPLRMEFIFVTVRFDVKHIVIKLVVIKVTEIKKMKLNVLKKKRNGREAV